MIKEISVFRSIRESFLQQGAHYYLRTYLRLSLRTLGVYQIICFNDLLSGPDCSRDWERDKDHCDNLDGTKARAKLLLQDGGIHIHSF